MENEDGADDVTSQPLLSHDHNNIEIPHGITTPQTADIIEEEVTDDQASTEGKEGEIDVEKEDGLEEMGIKSKRKGNFLGQFSDEENGDVIKVLNDPSFYTLHEVDTLDKFGHSYPSEYLSSADGDMNDKDRKDIKRLEMENIVKDVFVGHNEFTLRSVLAGILIGILVCAVNVNFGLRTGWTQGGSIFAAIISVAVFKLFEAPGADPRVNTFNQWEATISTTVASSVGIMCAAAGLASCIPALKLLDYTFNYWELLLWALAVGFLGIYFTYALRKKVIVRDRLPFPTGTATAQTIKATISVSHRSEYNLAFSQALVLLICSIGSAIWAFFVFLFPIIEEPPCPQVMYDYTLTLYLNPMLFGGGMLTGFRPSFSLCLGSILGWAILAPIVQASGWVDGEVSEMEGARGWILWLGVSIMLGESLTQLMYTLLLGVNEALKFCRERTDQMWYQRPSEKSHGKIGFDEQSRQEIIDNMKRSKTHVPWWWLVIGAMITTSFIVMVGSIYFSIKWYFCFLSIPLSALLSLIAIRCTGETDINPVGVLGKVTQLIFAAIAPGQVNTNILAAGIVAAGASGSGDFMQDLKVGYMTRVAPRKQFYAQIIGIICGCFVATGIYMIYTTAYDVGVDSAVPAPAAHAWKAVAILLDEGLDGLPVSTKYAMLAGLLMGIGNSALRMGALCIPKYGEKIELFFPSALAFGLGMLVPAKMSFTMMAGATFFQIWKLICYCTETTSCRDYYYAVSSGLMTGEGLMGIVVAIMRLLGVNSIVDKVFY